MKKNRAAILIIGILIGVGGVWLTFRQLTKPEILGPDRGNALVELSRYVAKEPGATEALRNTAGLVLSNYEEYRKNTVRWSALYHGCLFGSALLSALAGLVIKLTLFDKREGFRKDLAAVLAAAAALLITLTTVGAFERKWRANRMAAADMENLAYDLLKKGAGDNIDSFLSAIQSINARRNREIVTADDATPRERPASPAEEKDR